MMSELKLKPCPFCGGELEMSSYCNFGDWFYFAMCPKCRAKSDVFDTPEKAAAAWNRRVDDAKVNTSGSYFGS